MTIQHISILVESFLSYLGLVLSVVVGILVFNETPRPEFFVGAALVVSAAIWVSLDARRRARREADILRH